jgi:hypothetical protein
MKGAGFLSLHPFIPRAEKSRRGDTMFSLWNVFSLDSRSTSPRGEVQVRKV